MSINLTVPETPEGPELKPRISVIGVGGAGGNAVNNMIAANLEGCDFLVANTDSQALTGSKAEQRLQLGAGVTKGLGAGSKPEVGRQAAEESLDEVIGQLEGSNMVFIAAGMGGGTGTGAAPVIARAARERGILTVGVVTKPFQFEGAHRSRLADAGIDELSQFVDTLIIIPNQNLFRVANEKTTFADAFRMADDVLYSGVRSITDLMVMPGLINLDFADVQSVMAGMGRAMMGTGEAEGERRAIEAAEAAISNPLLDDASMKGARGVLINITGGPDITLFEVDEAANRVRSEVDEEAYIIIGSAFDQNMEGHMRVSVVAAGLAAQEAADSPHIAMLNATRRLEPVRVSRQEAPAEPEAPAAAAAAFGLGETLEVNSDDGLDPSPEEAPAEELNEELEVSEEAALDALGDIEDDLGEAVEPAAGAETEITKAGAPAPAETPSAMPASGAADTFVPAKPMETAAIDRSKEPVRNQLGVTDLINGGKAAEPAGTPKPGLLNRVKKERGLSLFERATGIGRGSRDESNASRGGGTASALDSGTTAVQSRPPSAAASTQPVTQPPATRTLEKPRLAAQPDDRPHVSQPEDDLLDIPAFLRRQAN